MNKKRKIDTIQLARHLIQLISFLLLPGLFVIFYNAFRDIAVAFMHGSFTLDAFLPRLLIFAGISLITAVFGRFFCGYVCLFGSLGDLIYSIAGKLFKKRKKISAKADRWLKKIKYVVLAFLVIGVWALAFPVSTSLSPWFAFGGLVSGSAVTTASVLKTAGFVLFICIVIGSAFIERFFCRYFCPMGAMFSLISRKRPYAIKRDTDKCTSCGLCSRKCSMGLEPHKEKSIRSGECIQCMKCVSGCPTKRLSTGRSPVVMGILIAAAIVGLTFGARFLPEKPIAAINTSSASSNLPADGVYTGTGNGFRGEVTAEVTITDGIISNIVITDHSDDSEFFNRSKETISSKIISQGSTDVDGVCGATYSSKGIIEAVEDALTVK